MRFQGIGRGLLAGLLLCAASSATATPVTYFFTTGSVTLTATVGGSGVAGPVTVPLTGVSVTVDEATTTLNSISFSIGTTGSIAISPAYLGYTSVNIDFASVTASGGTLSLFDAGPPAGYTYTIPNVTVSGQFDAVNANPVNNITDAYFGFVNPSATGTVYVDALNGLLVMDGVTLGSIDPDGPGGVDPLVLKGDFTFEGMVPEPGTALLLGSGLAGLAGARRRALRA